jgi:hypothetical protein
MAIDKRKTINKRQEPRSEQLRTEIRLSDSGSDLCAPIE